MNLLSIAVALSVVAAPGETTVERCERLFHHQGEFAEALACLEDVPDADRARSNRLTGFILFVKAPPEPERALAVFIESLRREPKGAMNADAPARVIALFDCARIGARHAAHVTDQVLARKPALYVDGRLRCPFEPPPPPPRMGELQAPSVVPSGPPTPPEATAIEVAEPPRSAPIPWGAWAGAGIAGAGVASIAVGLVFRGAANGHADDARALDTTRADYDASYAAVRADYDDAKAGAQVAYGVGIAASVVGVAWALLSLATADDAGSSLGITASRSGAIVRF